MQKECDEKHELQGLSFMKYLLMRSLEHLRWFSVVFETQLKNLVRFRKIGIFFEILSPRNIKHSTLRPNALALHVAKGRMRRVVVVDEEHVDPSVNVSWIVPAKDVISDDLCDKPHSANSFGQINT